MTTGSPDGDQATPTSLLEPYEALAVLSASLQPFGRLARKRSSDVWLASIHVRSRRRSRWLSACETNSRWRFDAVTYGDVVSRGSSGSAELSASSQRSSRVTSSPSDRKNAVSPGGPPISRSRRLPAVLSLSVIAASHSSRTSMPSATCSLVTGAYSRTSRFG